MSVFVASLGKYHLPKIRGAKGYTPHIVVYRGQYAINIDNFHKVQ